MQIPRNTFKDGIVICAEEERFRRIKKKLDFPSESIKFCLTDAKISVEDLDYITISRDPRSNVFLNNLYYKK